MPSKESLEALKEVEAKLGFIAKALSVVPDFKDGDLKELPQRFGMLTSGLAITAAAIGLLIALQIEDAEKQ